MEFDDPDEWSFELHRCRGPGWETEEEYEKRKAEALKNALSDPVQTWNLVTLDGDGECNNQSPECLYVKK